MENNAKKKYKEEKIKGTNWKGCGSDEAVLTFSLCFATTRVLDINASCSMALKKTYQFIFLRQSNS